MRARAVSPPRGEWERLRPALTTGELAVARHLDEALDPGWEMYLQPHLNGLRPDLVLLHPEIGIGVVEVKDWRLGRGTLQRDGARLVGRDQEGNRWIQLNPLQQLLRYRNEIADLYCFGLDARAGLAAVGGSVVLFNASTSEARSLIGNPEGSLTVVGRDGFKEPLESFFPPAGWPPGDRLMSPGIADELRHWLVEPNFSAEQRQAPELDIRQREFATTRTPTGYRRVRGPAGAGKSLVLAARAAALQEAGLEVLVVSYNHTLRGYLRDLAARFGARTTQITWLGFHEWAKRVMFAAGCGPRYGELFSESARRALDSGLAAEVVEILSSPDLAHLACRYDAILVDEGQDFRPEWWNALRLAVRDGGEMVLVADRAQDVYSQNKRWTDDAMHGAGFRGPWSELVGSYRLPSALVDDVREFAAQHLRLEEHELPRRSPQLHLSDEAIRLYWHQVEQDQLLDRASQAIARILRDSERDADLLAVADVVVLCDRKRDGVELTTALERRGVRCITTFHPDSRVERKKKLNFFKGNARVKVTTVHSFKGWETRALVVIASEACEPAVLYTALTRLTRHEGGSFLAVICASERYAPLSSAWEHRDPATT